MDQYLIDIIKLFSNGGPTAIIAILTIFCGLLIWDRIRLVKALDSKDKRLEGIVTDYYKGNINLTEALSNVKLVLIEIKSKL